MTKKIGLSPQLREALAAQGKGMGGDLVWSVTPATVSTPATGSAWTRKVSIALETAGGEVHEWFTKDIANGVSIADTSTAGTASIPSTTLSVVNGRAEVEVSGDAATWAAAETDTLTVASATIMGYTVAAATSVETFT